MLCLVHIFRQMRYINFAALGLLLSLSSCGEKSNQSIVGEWILIEAMEQPVTSGDGFIRFNEDGTLEQTEIPGIDPQYKASTTWLQKGDSICQTVTFVNLPEMQPVESCYTFKLDGGNLTLDFEGMTAKYKRKQV
jgi:hypothetical protein